jgi:hypothetical protein
MGTPYRCQNPRRAASVRGTPDRKDPPVVNGIDYLEVLPDQRTLELHFIHDFNAFPNIPKLEKENLEIRGGVRIPKVSIKTVTSTKNVLKVTVEEPGDFSVYTLALRTSASDATPPKGYDPLLSEIRFSFKVDCPSDFDCQPEANCPPEVHEEPQLDYLAKDYDSFRRLMLDRLSLLTPNWQERNPADLQVALVEVLAYVGDHLSYYQDAVASEAYLGTAQHRPSLRRHAKLLDYPMHDGCNARVWVTVSLSGSDGKVLPGPNPETGAPGTLLLTRSGLPEGPLLEQSQLAEAMNQGARAFETLHDIQLWKQHEKMDFYTWGDERCCLPKGATRAFLKGRFDDLSPGMVLIFEEVVSPTTGIAADANPNHRHAVRLTEVITKRGGRVLKDVLTNQEITEIVWGFEDALPFPLCLSALTDKQHDEQYLGEVSVARGNVVLADHGYSLPPEKLAGIQLKEGPVTQQGQVPTADPKKVAAFNKQASARAAMLWDMGHVLPAVRVEQDNSEDTWEPQRDLLNSDAFDRHFVLESEDNGTAYLRFGDGQLGQTPSPGVELTARYRVGNGSTGNIGADTLANIWFDDDPKKYPDVANLVSLKQVSVVPRNPMPARGGRDPEPLEQVRRYAPQAFRVQERAVTEADYAEVAERHPEVQKAAATFRWTGSWLTVFVTLDRKGGRPLDAKFLEDIHDHLERYRLAGFDLELDPPVFVPLELALSVCAKPGYFQSDVKQGLLTALSNRDLPDGRQGFFHPDRFTFGQPVYLSQLYQAALAVPGVDSLTIDTFKRFRHLPNQEKEQGVLKTKRLEIVQLDNDPNFPEHGKLDIRMQGGL